MPLQLAAPKNSAASSHSSADTGAGGYRSRVQQTAVVAVVATVGPQVRRQGEVVARAALLAGLAEGAAEAEVGEVVDRVGLDDGLELDGGRGEAAGAEVGAAQRLADRGLLGGAAGGLGQRRGRMLEVAVLKQLKAAAVERVGGLDGSLAGHPESVGGTPHRPKNRDLAGPTGRFATVDMRVRQPLSGRPDYL